MNALIFYLKYFMNEMKFLSDKSINIIIEMKSKKKEMKIRAVASELLTSKRLITS
jgi:hypothetical protein